MEQQLEALRLSNAKLSTRNALLVRAWHAVGAPLRCMIGHRILPKTSDILKADVGLSTLSSLCLCSVLCNHLDLPLMVPNRSHLGNGTLETAQPRGKY